MTAFLRRRAPLLTVLGFALACVLGFGWLWSETGAGVPGVPAGGYRLSFATSDVKNLREVGEVRIAGVTVGHVTKTAVDKGQAKVDLSLDQGVPLHEGVTVRVGVKALVGSSYVDVVDGHGAPLPSGTTLPAASVKQAVDVDELYDTLDPRTRQSLSQAVRSLGTATEGTGTDVGELMQGAGVLGQQGKTVLDALAAQSDDLKTLSGKATSLLDALDTGRGQIASVVGDAQTLTKATSGEQQAVSDTMRALPGMLDVTRTAGGKLGELSPSLAPIASDLRQAAPFLEQALLQLPQVTGDLRGLLPDLNATLDKAPATLDRVPAFGGTVRALVPGARALLSDLNPMLGYLEPYGRDIGAMFGNFGATMDTVNSDGVRTIRLGTIFSPASVRNFPVKLPLNSLYWTNPYPLPGTVGRPAPFNGQYPHIQHEGN
ncbi:MCE family protein [Amycolatopsis sp. K13G38]|uniref:MCE family protein n=1 Tax=Amycolatopsis acididurans TaxID=2724524 RepID=A0ABX1J388_9PSEU|nr:MlaD family protein [Amycolatopsis acididurans]NKQ54233.1 MCE family protein [Amycolatopsis acididurans]